MGRPKGAKNRPKQEHVQYEFKEVVKTPETQEREEIMQTPTMTATDSAKMPVTMVDTVPISSTTQPEMAVAGITREVTAPAPSPIMDALASPAVAAAAPAPAPIIRELSAMEKKRIEDERLVKGTFVYRAKPGGRYMTALRKYKRDPNAKNAQGFLKIDMTDGKTYTVPKWVAEWLNGEADLSCCDWKHSDANINLLTEGRAPPERVPVFRFIIQDYAA